MQFRGNLRKGGTRAAHLYRLPRVGGDALMRNAAGHHFNPIVVVPVKNVLNTHVAMVCTPWMVVTA